MMMTTIIKMKLVIITITIIIILIMMMMDSECAKNKLIERMAVWFATEEL